MKSRVKKADACTVLLNRFVKELREYRRGIEQAPIQDDWSGIRIAGDLLQRVKFTAKERKLVERVTSAARDAEFPKIIAATQKARAKGHIVVMSLQWVRRMCIEASKP